MIHWVCKHFNDLSPAELYALMKLRSEVFVVEQQCVYLDADGKDQWCYHLMGYQQELLVAYTRLVPANVSYAYISIGRVVTAPTQRRTGIGKALMIKSIEQSYELFGIQPIKIGAQLYLKKFYNSFGFEQCGDEYDEDGIPHIPMLLEVKTD